MRGRKYAAHCVIYTLKAFAEELVLLLFHRLLSFANFQTELFEQYRRYRLRLAQQLSVSFYLSIH